MITTPKQTQRHEQLGERSVCLLVCFVSVFCSVQTQIHRWDRRLIWWDPKFGSGRSETSKREVNVTFVYIQQSGRSERRRRVGCWNWMYSLSPSTPHVMCHVRGYWIVNSISWRVSFGRGDEWAQLSVLNHTTQYQTSYTPPPGARVPRSREEWSEEMIWTVWFESRMEC